MADLSLEVRTVDDDIAILSPKGFINAHTVRQFEDELSQAVGDGRVKLVINGAGLDYIASAGLGVIMGMVEDVRAKGGDIRLVELNETVTNIFEVLGFHHLCRVLQTEQQGLDSYQASMADSGNEV